MSASERRIVGVEDDEEIPTISIMYTDNDKAMSFAREIKSGNGPDRFGKEVDELRQLDGLSVGMKSKMTRRINKYLRGDEDSKSKAKHHEDLTGYGIFGVVPPLYNLDYLARLYEIDSTHYAAVNAKVANIVSLGYRWEETPKTQERIAQLVSEENEDRLERARRRLTRIRVLLDDWLESLNEEDSFIETLEKVYADKEVMGVGYLEIGRTSTGEIGYVGHIPAHTIRMRKQRDGYVQIVANTATYFRNFGDRETVDPIGDDPEPNEIIAFRKYSTRSTYYGTPDIVSALGAVAGSEFASRFNLDYFEHKAVPRYIVMVKGAQLDRNAEKRLVEFFQTNLKGENHRSLYIPMPKAMKDAEIEIIPVENKIQDASFQKYHDMTRDEILMVHRVPKSKVALDSSAGLGASREQDKMFKEQVTRPAQEHIERKLKPVIAEKTDVYVLKFNELTLTDEETKSKIHERYARIGGMLQNEIREDLGLKGIPGGDELKDTLSTAQRAAEMRSQVARGRERERADDDGPNNSDPSTRQTDGDGDARNQ